MCLDRWTVIEHRRMMRLGRVMVALVMATVGLASAGADAAVPRPAAMVLAQADLPKELGTWGRIEGEIVDNASVSRGEKTSLSAVVGSGRLIGYDEVFVVRLVSLNVGGKRQVLLPHLDAVFSDVGVYDSAAAAQRRFINWRHPTYRAVPTSARVGEQTRLYKGTAPSPYPGVPLGQQDVWVVAWRDGALLAQVGVSGPFPTGRGRDCARASAGEEDQHRASERLRARFGSDPYVPRARSRVLDHDRP
jgi:hypothetical protein